MKPERVYELHAPMMEPRVPYCPCGQVDCAELIDFTNTLLQRLTAYVQGPNERVLVAMKLFNILLINAELSPLDVMTTLVSDHEGMAVLSECDRKRADA